MTPGSNILNQALTIIAKQAITYLRATGRTLNNVGQDVTTYAAPVVIYGSFQPVPQQLYIQYGLDFQKSYFRFFTSNDAIDIKRDVSCDQIIFDNKLYKCESNTEWFKLDGWKEILCVYVGAVESELSIFGFNEVPLINENVNFENGTFINEGA